MDPSLQQSVTVLLEPITSLGIPAWILLTSGIPIILMFIYRMTGSWVLATVSSQVVIGILAFMGFIPMWLVLASGLPVGLLIASRLFGTFVSLDGVDMSRKYNREIPTSAEISIQVKEAEKRLGGALMAPNQLIQDPNKLPVKRLETGTVWPSGLPKTTDINLGRDFKKYPEGLVAFKDLNEEYEGLSTIFKSRGLDNSLVNTKKIGDLASGLYTQGTSLLVKTLSLFQQRDISDLKEITDQTTELKSELTKYTEGTTMYSMISDRINKNTSSIKLVKGVQNQIDEALMQTGLCTDSIRELRLQLPSLMGHLPQDEFNKAITELNVRIDYAQRVQAEYRRQGL